MTGEDTWYGMGLEIDHKYGIAVVSHRGSMGGFKSNFWFLPDSGEGLVILTNSDTGGILLGPLGRRLPEVLFDGKPEAAGNVASAAANYKADVAKTRERLVVPADATIVKGLAHHYSNAQIGQLNVITSDSATILTSVNGKARLPRGKTTTPPSRLSLSTPLMTNSNPWSASATPRTNTSSTKPSRVSGGSDLF